MTNPFEKSLIIRPCRPDDVLRLKERLAAKQIRLEVHNVLEPNERNSLLPLMNKYNPTGCLQWAIGSPELDTISPIVEYLEPSENGEPISHILAFPTLGVRVAPGMRNKEPGYTMPALSRMFLWTARYRYVDWRNHRDNMQQILILPGEVRPDQPRWRMHAFEEWTDEDIARQQGAIKDFFAERADVLARIAKCGTSEVDEFGMSTDENISGIPESSPSIQKRNNAITIPLTGDSTNPPRPSRTDYSDRPSTHLPGQLESLVAPKRRMLVRRRRPLFTFGPSKGRDTLRSVARQSRLSGSIQSVGGDKTYRYPAEQFVPETGCLY